tara:strand:+ start:1072 stop:1575 length:504 start_codon:yes stop_codon:yes gene_type:complete
MLLTISTYTDFFARNSNEIVSLKNIRGIVTNVELFPSYKSVRFAVKIEDDEVYYLSHHPYPEKFEYGRRTPEYLYPGDEVEIILTEEEYQNPPKTHRIDKYKWKEFVGLKRYREEELNLLIVEKHFEWVKNNNILGLYLYPVFVLMSAWLLFKISKSKHKKRTRRLS